MNDGDLHGAPMRGKYEISTRCTSSVGENLFGQRAISYGILMLRRKHQSRAFIHRHVT
jgi:hypothetical protein